MKRKLKKDEQEEGEEPQKKSHQELGLLKASSGKEASLSKDVRSKEEREQFKHSLYRPPTSEELNELRETEDLYKNNLFRLQISYLLEEVKAADKKVTALESFMHSLKEFLGNLKTTGKQDLSDLSWLPNDIHFPAPELCSRQMKGHFFFAKPSCIKVIGSYLLKTVTKPNYNVDIAVEIPKEVFQGKDHLNFRYHMKRAIYLMMLASHLKNWDAVEKVRFGRMENNPLKPIIIVKPAGKAGSRYIIKIHPMIPEDVFKLARFEPLKSNIRSHWFFGKEKQESDEEIGYPTPKYNAGILADMLFEKHLALVYDAICDCNGMVDAITLLKVWLHQRNFTEGESCFNGFQISMLISYLFRSRKISSHMSSYQIFRITLQHLATHDWTTKGISMVSCENNSNCPSLEDFHSVYEVVFVDSSGYLNLCANMRKSSLEQLQYEAKLAIQFLEDANIDGFEALFMRKLKFDENYDHWFRIITPHALKDLSQKSTMESKLMDNCGDWLPVVLDWIMPILRKGLGNRIDCLGIRKDTSAVWSLDSAPPESCMSGMTIGFHINKENAGNVLDMGPAANDPEAHDFRQFWGEKSDLRRFKDGSINEAVLWEANSKAEKRMICKQVVEYLLKKYCGLQPASILYHADQLDGLLRPKYKTEQNLTEKKQKDSTLLANSTGEENALAIIYAFDELCRQIQNLKGLPLDVNSIQGVSPVFRMTEVFPPRCSSHGQCNESKADFQCPNTGRHSAWCPAVEAVLQFEGSGKWPDDIDAIQYMKAAFYIQLATLLEANCSLTALASRNFLDVLKDGYVFRIRIFHYREMILCQQSKATGKLKKQHEFMARYLDLNMVKRPLHTTMIHSIHQKYPSYGLTTRLAKRWISAQMLHDYLCEEAIELLVASLFVTPAPYRTPNSQTSGFLRFLTMLSTYDWHTNPVIVDLNDSMKAEDCTRIRESFQAKRQQLPLIFIATPYDDEHSIWTRENLSLPVLRRLVTLAKASREILERNCETSEEDGLKLIFRPPLEDYDVLIELERKQLPRHYQAVDSSVLIKRPKHTTPKPNSMPVVQFDPVQRYLSELNAAFSEVAMFFYDKFGSTVIGVTWKPHAFIPQPLKILDLKYKVPVTNQKIGKIPKPNKVIFQIEMKAKKHGGVKNFSMCM